MKYVESPVKKSNPEKNISYYIVQYIEKENRKKSVEKCNEKYHIQTDYPLF